MSEEEKQLPPPTALARREPKQLAPVLALEKIAQHAYQSGMFKRYPNASAAYVVCAFGYELGMSPIAALTSIHCIEGKPVMSANLMAALVYSSGTHDLKILRRDNKGCVIEWRRKKDDGGWEVMGQSSFTEEDARLADLNTGKKDNWKKYPRAMYFSRAVSEGFKVYCPHLANGHTIYTPDELGAAVNEDGEMIDVPAVIKIDPPKKKAKYSLDDLRKVMGETNTSEDRINEIYGTGSLEDLLDDEIEDAVNKLNLKLEADIITIASQQSSTPAAEEVPVTTPTPVKKGKKK